LNFSCFKLWGHCLIWKKSKQDKLQMKGTLFLSTCVVVVWADIIHATNKQARTNGQNDQAEQGRGVALGAWHLAGAYASKRHKPLRVMNP
jgi:lysophospholipid acyltransferase (LPLAT)-like uncharacterized protein